MRKYTEWSRQTLINKRNRSYDSVAQFLGYPFEREWQGKWVTVAWHAVRRKTFPHRWAVLCTISYIRTKDKRKGDQTLCYESGYIFFSAQEAMLLASWFNDRKLLPKEAEKIWKERVATF